MLKLRREFSRAITILEMVKKREKSKRELLHLTLEVVEKRYMCTHKKNTICICTQVCVGRTKKQSLIYTLRIQVVILHQNSVVFLDTWLISYCFHRYQMSDFSGDVLNEVSAPLAEKTVYPAPICLPNGNRHKAENKIKVKSHFWLGKHSCLMTVESNNGSTVGKITPLLNCPSDWSEGVD